MTSDTTAAVRPVLTAADVEAMPDSDERAVLLAALWAEMPIENVVGRKGKNVVLKFVHTPERKAAPAATIAPIALDDPGPITDNIVVFSALLVRNVQARNTVVDLHDEYLGVALYTEGWDHTVNPITGEKLRIETRTICGMLASGKRFYLKQRWEGQPSITFDMDSVPRDTDLTYTAVEILHTAFTIAHES